MIPDPESVLLQYPLFKAGTLYIGRSSIKGACSGERNPLMARIEVPDSLVPKGWFLLEEKSIIALQVEMERDYIIAFDANTYQPIPETKRYVIPPWMWSLCYRYHCGQDY